MKGLQIFYPINPRACLLFYDNEVYDIKANNLDLVGTEDAEDINQLNLLQFLNSDQNLYFDERISSEYMENLKELSQNIQEVEKNYLRELTNISNENGKNRILLNIHNSFKTNLSLSFIKGIEGSNTFPFEIYRKHFLEILEL